MAEEAAIEMTEMMVTEVTALPTEEVKRVTEVNRYVIIVKKRDILQKNVKTPKDLDKISEDPIIIIIIIEEVDLVTTLHQITIIIIIIEDHIIKTEDQPLLKENH